MPGIPKNKPRDLNPIAKPERKSGAGRPDYKPLVGERRAVWIALACGIPHDEIAKHMNDGLGIAPMTLRKHFRKELNEGMWEANLEAAGTLLDTVKNCRDLKVKQRATEFWLERRMGFTLKNLVENAPSKLIISVEGGLPRIEHPGYTNGIDLEDANSEDTDQASDSPPWSGGSV